MSLYKKNPYKKQMNVTIENTIQRKGNTHFFLENSIVAAAIPHYSTGDIAQINGKDVIIEKDSNGTEKFTVADLDESENAILTIDWSHRLQMMQNNIGRILLRIAFKQLLDITPLYENTETNPYFDLPLSDLGFQTLEKLEDLTNRMIQSNFPIEYEDEEWEKVKIGSYPSEKSYGPKLQNTGECAVLSLGNIEKIEQGLRLYYFTGQQAISDYRRHRSLVRNLGIFFQTSDPGKIWSEVKKLSGTVETLKSENKQLESSLGLEEVQEFIDTRREVEGISYIYRVLNDVNFKNIKNVISTIQQKKGFVQIYGIPNGTECQVIVARSQDVPVDLKEIMDSISHKFSIQGSGNMFKIQGNCSRIFMHGVMEEFLLAIQTKMNLKNK